MRAMEYEFVLNSVKHKLFLVSIVKIIKMIIRFFFINILTQKKLLLLNRKNYIRKTSNVSYFGKKTFAKRIFCKAAMIYAQLLLYELYLCELTHTEWVPPAI